LPHFSQRNDVARRFNCPVLRRALETGQTSFFFQEAKAISALKAPVTLLLSL
jgi:hypothetical protein